jgi:hypothetical protein
MISKDVGGRCGVNYRAALACRSHLGEYLIFDDCIIYLLGFVYTLSFLYTLGVLYTIGCLYTLGLLYTLGCLYNLGFATPYDFIRPRIYIHPRSLCTLGQIEHKTNVIDTVSYSFTLLASLDTKQRRVIRLSVMATFSCCP